MSVFSTFSGAALLLDPFEHPAASIMIATADATPTFWNLIVSLAELPGHVHDWAASANTAGRQWPPTRIVIQHNAPRCPAHPERDYSRSMSHRYHHTMIPTLLSHGDSWPQELRVVTAHIVRHRTYMPV